MLKNKEIARKLIDESGLSDAKIAERMGMTPAGLSYHFTKETDIDIDVLEKIKNAINPKKIIEEDFAKPNNIETNISYLVNELRKKDLIIKDLQEKFETLKKEQK